MEQLCDLHTHTTASDGSYTPEELVRYAKQKGVAALAVTDHDTLSGLQRAVQEGERIGQQVIPGIAITTKLEGCEVHVVGLFIRWQDTDFAARVEKLSKSRDERNQKVLQILIDNGFEITDEDMEPFRGSVVTKAHIGQILVNHGYASTVSEAISKYLLKGGIAYVEREMPTPQETLDVIHQGGGLAFIAHTNQIDRKDRDRSCELCQRMLDLGVDGLETRYCEFDDDWRGRTEAIARRNGCLRSGGSDFHGTFKAGLDMLTGYGDLKVPYEYVERIKERLGIGA